MRGYPSLEHMKECGSTSPDLILIEKPIVQIDISNDDDGSNTAIENGKLNCVLYSFTLKSMKLRSLEK